MKCEEARKLLKQGQRVRRPRWFSGWWLWLQDGRPVWGPMDEFGDFQESQAYLFQWDDLEAEDWEVAPAPSVKVTSICDHAVWDSVRPYFGERPHELRGLEVRGLSRPMSLRLQQLTLPCIACGKSTHVFRRRKGADISDLYYSPACPSAQSPGCSRGAENRDEIDRIRSFLEGNPIPKPQLGLFR